MPITALLIAAWWIANSHRALADPPYQELMGHTGSVYAIAYSPDGHRMASGGADRIVRFWQIVEDAQSDSERQRRQQLLVDLDDDLFEKRQTAFEQLAMLGPEIRAPLELLLTKPPSTEVRLRVLRLLQRLDSPSGQGHKNEIRAICFSPDGSTVASASRDGSIRLWNFLSGLPFASLIGHSDGAWSVAFSPDGQKLASGGGDHSIKIWNPGTGKAITRLTGHQSTVQQLTYSGDGTLLISAGGFDRTTRIWRLNPPGEVAVLNHPDAVMCCAMTRDGQSLVSGGYGSQVLVVQDRDWTSPRNWDVGISTVRCCAFSRKNDLLALAGDDRVVRVWSWPDRQLQQTFTAPSETIFTLAFSSSGKELAAAGRNGTIVRWPLPSGGFSREKSLP